MITWLIKINQRIYTTLSKETRPNHFEILQRFSQEPEHVQREFRTDQGWIVEIEPYQADHVRVPNQQRQVSRRIN